MKKKTLLNELHQLTFQLSQKNHTIRSTLRKSLHPEFKSATSSRNPLFTVIQCSSGNFAKRKWKMKKKEQ